MKLYNLVFIHFTLTGFDFSYTYSCQPVQAIAPNREQELLNKITLLEAQITKSEHSMYKIVKNVERFVKFFINPVIVL